MQDWTEMSEMYLILQTTSVHSAQLMCKESVLVCKESALVWKESVQGECTSV